MKNHLMIFILLSTLFTACGGGESNESSVTPPVATRNFQMGFTPWLYEASFTAQDMVYDQIQNNGDIISQQLLTRQQYISYSGLQACIGSRRSVQAMVVPLSSAATRSRGRPEAPTRLIVNDRPPYAGPQTALANLAVEWL